MAPDTLPTSARLASFTVGDWLVDPKACLASRDGTVVKLRPQLVDLLLCLARRQGEIVLKDEILAQVWPGQYIADSGLSRCVAELRQLLRDDARQPQFIETIPKRGYRLIVPVRWVEDVPASPPPPGQVPAPAECSAPRGRPRPRVGTFAVLAVAGTTLAIAAIVFQATRSRPTVLTERDTVLLADVRNVTGDRAFDDALRLALAVNLEQAPFLRILPQEAVRGALARAGRAPDERVVGPLALEVCRREGAAVLLAGSIASLGSRYVIGVEAIACGTGESVGRAMSEAASKERVLAALEQAATRIRKRLGESRESLRQFDVPLVRATTPSFDALVALTRGDLSRDKGRHEAALPYYRQATEIDPEFALAWARRGLTARNVDLREEAIPALRRAFELRGRVSQPERFFIEGLYHRFVAAEPERAVETFRAWKRLYPGSAIPPNYIAATLSDEMGQYDAAVLEAREAVRLEPNTSWPYNNLAQACMGARLFDEVKQVVAEAGRRGIDDWSMHAYLLILALAEGDQAAVERETRWAAASPQTAVMFLRVRAAAAASVGRLGEARRLWREALDKAAETGMAGHAAAVHLDRAEAEALLGDVAWARRRAAPGGADTRGRDLVHHAIVREMVADTARARALIAEARRRADDDPAPLRVWLPVAEALIVARQGRPADALAMLQPVARHERANDYLAIPLAVRGLVSAMAGQHSAAASAFEDVLRLNGVIGPSPWEAVARLGLARALRDSGDKTGSRAAYDAFLQSWKDADRDLPLLQAAERERGALPSR